ncbi:hypothetical protein D3C78_605900 [compost metagenome]
MTVPDRPSLAYARLRHQFDQKTLRVGGNGIGSPEQFPIRAEHINAYNWSIQFHIIKQSISQFLSNRQLPRFRLVGRYLQRLLQQLIAEHL